MRTEIDGAAAHLEASRDALIARPAEIADQIAGARAADLRLRPDRPGRLPLEGQINENAKQHAFQNQLPELDHNEIVGWDDERWRGFAAIFLEDSDQHPRQRQRAELTAKLIEPQPQAVIRVVTEGETGSAPALDGHARRPGLAAARRRERRRPGARRGDRGAQEGAGEGVGARRGRRASAAAPGPVRGLGPQLGSEGGGIARLA